MNLIIKLLILGNQFVGKTSLLKRFNNNPINDYYMSTIGIDYDSVKFRYKDNEHKIILWDTSGQNKFNFILDVYFKTVSGAIIMYDVTDIHSYTQAEKWVQKFKNDIYKNNNLPIIVLSNKIDLDKNRVLFDKELLYFKEKYGVNILDISVQENINIEHIFPKIFDDLMPKIYNNIIIPSKNNGIKIIDTLETIIEEPIKTKECCIML